MFSWLFSFEGVGRGTRWLVVLIWLLSLATVFSPFGLISAFSDQNLRILEIKKRSPLNQVCYYQDGPATHSRYYVGAGQANYYFC